MDRSASRLLTDPTMPLLARAKRNIGRKLSSSATVGEVGQNIICAYLSVALLIGPLANALAAGGGQTPPPHS